MEKLHGERGAVFEMLLVSGVLETFFFFLLLPLPRLRLGHPWQSLSDGCVLLVIAILSKFPILFLFSRLISSASIAFQEPHQKRSDKNSLSEEKKKGSRGSLKFAPSICFPHYPRKRCLLFSSRYPKNALFSFFPIPVTYLP